MQAVLGTVLPIIGSLSGIGNREPPDLSGALQLLPQILASLSGRAEPGEEPLEIGTLLQLAEPLLEGISGGDDDEEEGGEGGGGGSNVGAVLTALTPLVGLLSGVSTGLSGPGGPSGDADSGAGGGGGGSDLSSILGISNSSGGGSGGGGGGGQGNQLNEKLRILTDGVGLLLRVKGLIFRKLFSLLGSSSG
ncbi:hypothetical protein FOCC_FOCC001088 [Frankliniella occidentalis]|nr:hypothetical protein FOCC_FOCC001088 [Frankliniella occidentalis]